MPVNSQLLAEVKSRQYVLIARAGMAVPTQEMTSEQIYESMMTQFKHHVATVRLASGRPKNLFFRTSRHLEKEVSDKELRTGTSLWRKLKAIKKYVNNNITSIFVKNLGPDGQPPSGHTMDNVLLETRNQLYDAEQEISRNKSRNPGLFKFKPFNANWFPVEWQVFILFGRPSDHPESAFFIE